MKKLILAGIAVLLVMFFVTCDVGSPEDVVEYTDVEYSEDGSFITVYLDGSKPVPVTRAQRAITTNLAKMAYDYIEVLFVSTTGAVQTRARSTWELGQSAGISGVDRGSAGGSGVDYLYNTTGTNDGATKGALALMFVGRKDNKTLLGVGRILQVDREPEMQKNGTTGTWLWGANGLPTPVSGGSFTATIKEDTTSVTFWIEAVKTGLLIKGESPKPADDTSASDIEKAVAFDSFVSDSGANGLSSDTRLNATRSSINNSRASYPLYPLPEPKVVSGSVQVPSPVSANYAFGGGALTFKNQIKLDSPPEVDKRFPRYMDGGRYLAPQSNVDTETKVEVDYSIYTANTDDPFDNVVPLTFTLTKLSYGLFSFYIEIPVYLWVRTKTGSEANTKPTNGGPDATIWKIRTGLGSELYSLDDGRSSGGCVLMGVGVSALDWLEIYWDFVN